MNCEHETGPAIQDPPEPPSICGEDVVDTTDYCAEHLPLYDPDLAADLAETDLTDTINDTWENQTEKDYS